VDRLPTQLRADPGVNDSIAPAVAWAVGNRRYQLAVGSSSRQHRIKRAALRLHHLSVGVLPMAPHAVAASQMFPAGRQQQGIDVVFHIQPVAHVLAVAIERDRLTDGRLEDHHRDQLFGELSGAIVVRAVGEHHWQAVGVVAGVYQMVACGLAGQIGAEGGCRG